MSKEIDKIAFIELQDGKILSTRSKGKNKYYIPGGKREKNELDQETLVREIKEELSVSIIPSTIKYLGTFKEQADGHQKGIIVKMTCYEGEYEGTLKADNEIEEIKWLKFNDIEKVSFVDKKIFKFLHEKGKLK